MHTFDFLEGANGVTWLSAARVPNLNHVHEIGFLCAAGHLRADGEVVGVRLNGKENKTNVSKQERTSARAVNYT